MHRIWEIAVLASFTRSTAARRARRSIRSKAAAIAAIAVLLASGGFVAPGPQVPVARAASTIFVAATGPNGAGGSCVAPNYGPDSFGNSAEGAIEAAITAAGDNGTVRLCTGTFSLTTGEVTVTRNNVTFQGDSSTATIIDGNGAWQLFNGAGDGSTVRGKDVTFRDLTLRNGSLYGDGGAVCAANVTLLRVRVLGNYANGNGGAINASDGLDLTAGIIRSSYSLFEDNTSGSFRGGALYGFSGVTTLGDRFFRNSSGYTGGAISTDSGNVESTGGLYVDNTSYSSVAGGGAIAAVETFGRGRGSVRSRFDQFYGNYSEYGGGAIYAEGDVDSSGGTYEDNVGGYGGAISPVGSVRSLNDVFRRNSASDDGGAIDATSVDSTGGTYEDNTSGQYGGAIATYTTGNVTSNGDVFRRNSASDVGGAIYVVTGDLTSTRGVYEDNTSNTSGGALYADYGDITSRFDRFVRNHAESQGGAVYADGDIDSSAGTYEDNTANDSAGAVYATNMTSLNDAYRRNWGYGDGGAIIVNAIDVTGGTFEENTASTSYGGAIYSYGDTRIDRSAFARNTGGTYGGAVAQADTASALWVVNSTFVGNRLPGGTSGGALYAAADIHATYSTFVDNSAYADDNGDGISADGDLHLDHVLMVGAGLEAHDCWAGGDRYDAGFSIETGFGCLTDDGTSTGTLLDGDSTAGTDPADLHLGAFGANGGPTWTYSLSDGSLAIDFDKNLETCASAVKTDQRGVSRPKGDGCDTGAFEVGSNGGVTPLYNGPWWVNSSTATQNLSVAATIDPATAGCTVTFELSGATWTPSGPTGSTWSASTSGVSRSDGTVSAPLTNVPLGIYDVVVTVTGGCSAEAPDYAVIGVLPGTVGKGTVGGGWYRLGDSGGWKKSTFGDIVSVTSSYNKRTGITTTTTKGQLLWYSGADNSTGGSGWRLKAALSGSTTDGSSIWQPIPCPAGVGTTGSEAKCGRYTGTALLEQRRRSGRWIPAPYGSSGRVTFTVTVYDGGQLTSCVKKTCKITELADLFGITIAGVPVPTSASDRLPQVGSPVRLKNGSLRVF